MTNKINIYKAKNWLTNFKIDKKKPERFFDLKINNNQGVDKVIDLMHMITYLSRKRSLFSFLSYFILGENGLNGLN